MRKLPSPVDSREATLRTDEELRCSLLVHCSPGAFSVLLVLQNGGLCRNSSGSNLWN